MASAERGGGLVFIDTVEANCKSAAILGSRLARYLEANGFRLTPDRDAADFVVVNGCGFDEVHERLTLEAARSALGARKPGARVVSIGCLNRISPEGLASLGSGVEVRDDAALDEVFGPEVGFEELREAYLDDRLLARLAPHGDHMPLRHDLYVRLGELLVRNAGRLAPLVDPARAHLPAVLDELCRRDKLYVKIGSGCAGSCAFCIIRKARGGPRSRPIPDILADVERGYSGQGAVNLVGDDCGSYGVDTGDTIFDLLEALSRRFPGLPIELCHLNPGWLVERADRYVETLAACNVTSLNLSVQSGSDRVIALMSRRYRAETVVDFVERLRRLSPRTMIWGHMLIDYPTETWADFGRSLWVGRHLDFYFAFIYSPRPGTPAAALPHRSRPALGRLKQELCYLAQGVKVVDRLVRPDA